MNLEAFKANAKYAGYLLVLASFYFLGYILFDNIGSMKGISLSPVNIGILVVLIVLHFLGNGFSSYAWVLQLCNKYPDFKFSESLSLY